MSIRYYLLFPLMCIAIIAEAQTAQYATARIYESSIEDLSHISVVYETGVSKTISLLPLVARDTSKGVSFDGAYARNALISNQRRITEFLNDMSKEGYQIQEMKNTQESGYSAIFIVFAKMDLSHMD